MMLDTPSGFVTCCICGTTVPAWNRTQRTCGGDTCRWKRNEQLRSARPADVRRRRERCAHWALARRPNANRNPWLLGAPPYGTHLPGGGCELEVRPHPTWPVEHRNVRALHGLLTTLIREDHDPLLPGFALVPWPTRFGWGVYFRTEAGARLAGQTHRAQLFDRPVEVSFSPLRRLRAPVVAHRGRQRVVLDTVTPVCIRNNGTLTYTAPTEANLLAALVHVLPTRLQLEGFDPGSCVLRLLARTTEPAAVCLGGKYGVVRGFSGSVLVEVNAVGRFLLECAARVGYGGRTSLGFGRLRVTEAA